MNGSILQKIIIGAGATILAAAFLGAWLSFAKLYSMEKEVVAMSVAVDKLSEQVERRIDREVTTLNNRIDRLQQRQGQQR